MPSCGYPKGMRFLIPIFLLLSACGSSSNEEVTATNSFYGYKDDTSEITISKIKFIEKRSGMGTYQVIQAVVRKSDDAILRSNSFCGEFEVLGASAMTDLHEYGTKNYNYYYGFYESAYISEGAVKVGHVKESSKATYIDGIFTNEPSCL